MSYFCYTTIFATRDRQEILDEWQIPYSVDADLCFCFKNDQDKQTAIKILKAALELEE